MTQSTRSRTRGRGKSNDVALLRKATSIAESYRESDQQDIANGRGFVMSDLGTDLTMPAMLADANVDDVMKKVGCDRQTAKVACFAARNRLTVAAALEPTVTRDVVETTTSLGGEMHGLRYRMKTSASLARKIADDMLVSDTEPTYEASQAQAAKTKDVLRYTSVFPPELLAQAYEKTKQSLLSKGYNEMRCKNFFLRYAQGNAQQKAIQSVFVTPDGMPFELQFHTLDDLMAKNASHRLYEKWRLGTTSPLERAVLGARMYNMYEPVETPEGVLDIQEHG